MSVISCCAALMDSNTVIDGNLETFSSHIQGPSDSLEYSISVVLSYLHMSLKWVDVV